MDPEVLSLSLKLGEAAVRNSAATVADKITAAKARRRDQETIAELEEIISSLISDKNDLVLIAQSYEQELAARRISPKDVEYITKNIIPILKDLLGSGSGGEQFDAETEAKIDTLTSLLSVETIEILQLLGFNFRQAIGGPLTHLVAQLIASKVPASADQNAAIQKLGLERDLAYINLAQDPESYARLKGVAGS
ncbi:hypothetical protein ABT297_19655 [Dactylosporangium sp. NPDC000555]|uniref:hypothetical protein n=1 Tax=Dactylosporangium sp. NPDC000555 TaxID=3154260 RepID=UPI00332B35CB